MDTFGMVFKSDYKPVTELFGAPEPPKTGRGRLLHSAVNMIYLHGIHAVGIDQVIADAGVTKSTFYKHFESKDELLIEAIRLRDVWEGDAFSHAIHELAGDDPRAQLLALFDVLDIWFNDPDFHGCQFINVAAQVPNPHDPMHEVAANHKRQMRDVFRDMAKQAGVSDVEAFADTYTAARGRHANPASGARA
ncbi:MAG: TetR/AcrR family transcriptional regulator [Phycisphaerales bacterium]